MKKQKLILIDGNSIANRAFYAIPLLNSSKGQHTNAVYGFATMLNKLIEDEQPTHFLVAFDASKKTFRTEKYKDYKGTRMKTPPELSEQFDAIKELLASYRIPAYELEGYEADDIIGTWTKLADEREVETLVVTGDKDLLQLSSKHVTIALTRKGISETVRYTPEQIEQDYGLQAKQIIDLKGLMGDSSDNIPGIPGIGEKTGLKLLHQYGSVEEVLKNSGELKGKMKDKVEQHQEQAMLSKELATIFREVPLGQEYDELIFSGPDEEKLAVLYQELEFKSLLEKLKVPASESADQVEELEWIDVDEKNLDTLVDQLPTVKAVHVEVIHDNPHASDVPGAAFATDKQLYYISLDQLQDQAAAPIRKWLADERQKKSIYDVHRAKLALQWKGIELAGASFDVLLAAYLLDPTQTVHHTLDGLASMHDLTVLPSDEEIYGRGAKFKLPERKQLGEFICRKAQATLTLTPLLEKELEKNEMKSLFYDLELPLAKILAEMEQLGICVNEKDLQDYGAELDKKLVKIRQHIYDLAGEEFNLNSPKQLGEILFDKLGLPVVKKTKTGYSTDAEVLEKLESEHEVVAQLLIYRQLAKLQSTYVEGLTKEIRKGKIHTYFRQTVAATGRLSSQYPNLQNIPIRLEEGRKIRRIFVPSEKDWVILAADYSQIELRILAHLSGDPGLTEAFQNDMDIHTKTAMDVFDVKAEDVDSNMRRQAKAVNFGIVYGISDFGLSQNLNISRKAAAKFIEQYFNVFKGVKEFMEDIVKQAKDQGYVTTLLHRRRYLPDIRSSNFNKRSFAERTAMNTPIQGTAADVIKLAMVKMADKLKQEKARSRMLLQVHDELVFEVPEDEIAEMKKWVPEVMESAMEIDVPLKVDVSYGENWYEAK